jgi:SAM-dependent methyltransferase
MGTIDRVEGRHAFGSDPAAYHDARPAYPERVFEILQQRCGLRPGCRTFEIGPGTGICTRRLLELGASPAVVVEPDARLADFLTKTLEPLSSVDVRVATFERVRLPFDWFDLGASASAFHWLDERKSLHKVAQALRDGGWWAMWWNLFFPDSTTDEFHRATRFLFDNLDRSPSWGVDGRPSFALDSEARIANLRVLNRFENVQVDVIRWTVVLDTQRVMRLYATFSPISRLRPEKRQRLLDNLAQVSDKQFGGQVEFPITTPIYTAQRQRRRH